MEKMEGQKAGMMPTRPAGVWLGNDLMDGNGTPVLVDCFDKDIFRQTAVRLVMNYDDKPAVAALRAILRQHLELGRDVTIIDPRDELTGLDSLIDDVQTGTLVMPSRLDDGCADPFVLRAPTSWKPGMPTPQDEARELFRNQRWVIRCLLTPALRAWSHAWGWDDRESEQIIAETVDAFYAEHGINPDGPIDYARWEPSGHGVAAGTVPCMREFRRFLQREILSLHDASNTSMNIDDLLWFIRSHTANSRLSKDDHRLYVLTALSLRLEELCASDFPPLPYAAVASDDGATEARQGRVEIIRTAGFDDDPVKRCPYGWVTEAVFARLAIDAPARPAKRIVVIAEHALPLVAEPLTRMMRSVMRESHRVQTSIWYEDSVPESELNDTQTLHDMTPMTICFPHAWHRKAVRQLCDRTGVPDEIRKWRTGTLNGNAAVILRGLECGTWLVDTKPIVEAVEGDGR